MPEEYKMKSENIRRVMILSSLVCLLPLIFSLSVYDELPLQVAIHWNGAGQPDGFAHKALAAFGMPFVLLAIHLFSNLMRLSDPRRAAMSQVMQRFLAWLIPALSLVLVPVTLLIAMGADIPIALIAPVLVGLILIIIGNYLPKSRQNYTIGIKLPWTLHDADIWNRTHRMAGYLYILGGIIMAAGAFALRGQASFFVPLTLLVVLLLAVIPALYAFALYIKKNHVDQGEKEKI